MSHRLLLTLVLVSFFVKYSFQYPLYSSSSSSSDHAAAASSFSSKSQRIFELAEYFGIERQTKFHLPDHNIDISPINRDPTLTPLSSLAKRGENGAISSDLEICNNITINEIFKKFPHANAADAAVTMSLCIGMINFFNSGIGGGGYLVMHDHINNDNIHIDFREMAPLNIDAKMFNDSNNNDPEGLKSKIGGLAIAIPGELKGLYEIFKLKGSGEVTWEQLLDPIIKLGYEGWEIDEILAATLKIYKDFFLDSKEQWSFVLNSTQDGVLQRGDWVKRPALAKTLEILAKNGSVAPFYDPEGPLVKAMVSTIRDSNGIITPQDFADYDVHVTKPLTKKIRQGYGNIPHKDLTVITSSGSSSGAALIAALSIMDKFPKEIGGDYNDESNFQLIETMKWMASARSRLGDYFNGTIKDDKTYLSDNILEVLSENFTNKAIDKISKRIHIDPNTGLKSFQTVNNYSYYEPLYEINDPHGTAHFSIIDKENNAVSLTTTINLLFGSLVHDPITGVIFNNEIDDFSQENKCNSFDLAASIYNLIGPKRRPLSSTAPTIILNDLGKPDLVIGASGGSRITTAILQSIIRIYWYEMPLLETIAYPRVHHQLLPDRIEVEKISLIGKETIDNLMSMGYEILEQFPKSVVNAIQRDGRNFQWIAVSDYWRKRGISGVY